MGPYKQECHNYASTFSVTLIFCTISFGEHLRHVSGIVYARLYMDKILQLNRLLMHV
jgi:hypothetical protein